jgi:very-long-chain ceramide synthase
MPGTLKPYYLLQTAFWLQQSLLLGLGVEKPRRDFYEFVAHHIITLWMVIWSYIMNMTLTGNIIFLTMDWSEIFFAVGIPCMCYIQ